MADGDDHYCRYGYSVNINYPMLQDANLKQACYIYLCKPIMIR
jgi:hypothetical protein